MPLHKRKPLLCSGSELVSSNLQIPFPVKNRHLHAYYFTFTVSHSPSSISPFPSFSLNHIYILNHIFIYGFIFSRKSPAIIFISTFKSTFKVFFSRKSPAIVFISAFKIFSCNIKISCRYGLTI